MSNTTIKKKQAGIPSGGTTGQVLVKNSGTDFDYDWADVTGTITSGTQSISIPSPVGASTIHYRKVGKLYFDIIILRTTDSRYYLPGSPTSINFAHNVIDAVATALGVTVNTYYDNTIYTAGYIEDSGGVWTSGTINNNVFYTDSFLAN